MDEYYSIAETQERIVCHQADLDQKKAHYEAQKEYSLDSVNDYRLGAIRSSEYWLKFHRWELEDMLQAAEEAEED